MVRNSATSFRRQDQAEFRSRGYIERNSAFLRHEIPLPTFNWLRRRCIKPIVQLGLSRCRHSTIHLASSGEARNERSLVWIVFLLRALAALALRVAPVGGGRRRACCPSSSRTSRATALIHAAASIVLADQPRASMRSGCPWERHVKGWIYRIGAVAARP